MYFYLWTVPAFPEPSTLIICKSLYKMFPHVRISSMLPESCLLLPEFSSMGDSMSLELPWRVWTCKYFRSNYSTAAVIFCIKAKKPCTIKSKFLYRYSSTIYYLKTRLLLRLWFGCKNENEQQHISVLYIILPEFIRDCLFGNASSLTPWEDHKWLAQAFSKYVLVLKYIKYE